MSPQGFMAEQYDIKEGKRKGVAGGKVVLRNLENKTLSRVGTSFSCWGCAGGVCRCS